MCRKHHDKYIILHGSASTIAALLLVVYGWKASQVVSAYMRVETGHFWLSAHQATHIQLLFMLAVLAGIIQQAPDFMERWLRWRANNILRGGEKVALPAVRLDGWLFLAEGVPALIVMELPYILVGMGSAVWGSPLALIPPAASVYLGWGDFVVSSLGALWLGNTLVRTVAFAT
jgi:hypothetical protein